MKPTIAFCFFVLFAIQISYAFPQGTKNPLDIVATLAAPVVTDSSAAGAAAAAQATANKNNDANKRAARSPQFDGIFAAAKGFGDILKVPASTAAKVGQDVLPGNVTNIPGLS